MYRLVARLHWDLAQLWRFPVSWCTVWKGTYQDCMDHLRGSHNVPWEVKSASFEKFIPPWTVSRNVWTEALSAQYSGISTDVLLFSDIHLSLVHHYGVHRRGLPHIAFRRKYLSQLRALLPSPVTLPSPRVVSPVSSGSGSLRPVGSPEGVLGPARTMRRAHRRRRPVRVEEPAIVNVPVLTHQDPLAAVGAVVLDCRPPLLPVSMDISGVDLSAIRFPAMSGGGGGAVVPGSVVSSPAGDTEVAGGHQGLPDLSLEGPFDLHQDWLVSGAPPRVLGSMRGCQYCMGYRGGWRPPGIARFVSGGPL